MKRRPVAHASRRGEAPSEAGDDRPLTESRRGAARRARCPACAELAYPRWMRLPFSGWIAPVAIALILGCGSSGTNTSEAASASGSGASAGTGGAGGSGGTSGSGATGGTGGAAIVDLDGDGLDDALEAEIAASYLPFLSIDPTDGCPLGGVVYRAFPHPDDASLISVIYDHLFQNDCGLGGHVGDNEAFGVTVNPTKPAPSGIVSMRAVSHQGTPCERVTECGVCPGETACTTTMVAGVAWPVVFSSKDKHGGYALQESCNPLTTCFDSCALAPASAAVVMVNAGEPGKPLTNNLTTSGLITAANGWTEAELLDHDPWDAAKDFGGAGNIAGDLVDPAFVPPACK